MNSLFWDLPSRSERPAILRKNAAIMAYLGRSCALPAVLVRPARFTAISFILAGAGPSMSDEDLAVLADVVLFIFAVDDLVDESDLSIEDVSFRLGQYAACAAGEEPPEVAMDPIASLLRSISSRLRRGPLAASLWSQWTSRVRDMLAAMVEERRLSAALAAGAEPPGLASYLEIARDTVGIAVVVMAAWLLLGEPAMADGWLDLHEAERHLSLAARLANDLRTHEREREEGAVNAVVIVGLAGVEGLRRRLATELAAGRSILARRRAGTDRSARFLERSVSSVVSLYEEHDFHTIPEMLAA